MSWLYSQALVEAYLGENFSDGVQSAPLSGNPTQQAFLQQDKMTAFCRLSRFGMTYKPLTENLGEELLTLYLEGFRVRTSAQQEKEQVLMESGQACGSTLLESSEKWNQLSLSLKTPHSSEPVGLKSSLKTLPRWGMMLNGVVTQQPKLEQTTNEIECGSSPETHKLTWPTPRTKGMCGGSGSWALLNKNTTVEEARQMGAGNGGKLNPTWVEWLMGWPLGWTDLKPLVMDKSHCVPQKLGDC